MSDKSNAERKRAKKALLGVNFFVETNRLEPFYAVYLITFKGWSVIWIGIISLVSNAVMVLFQTPIGDAVDKISYKRSLMVVSILIASVTTTCIAWTSNTWIVLVAKVIEGLAATVFLPGLMSLLLGISLNEGEVPRLVAKTEVSNKIGSFLFVAGCGLITYFLYPDIVSMFYLLGAGGVAAAFFVMMIPSSAINYNRARQLKEDTDDDKTIPNQGNDSSNDEKKKPEAISYSELLKDKNICSFAIITFFYHLANASVSPLIAQYLAIGGGRSAMLFTSGTMLPFYFFQGITAHLMQFFILKVSPKTILVWAHIVLPMRCCLIVLFITFFDNKYIVCATQIFDGIGAGLYDTMIPIVVSKMVTDTGRFGFTFGFIITSWRLGHGFSLFLGEFIVHASSYEVAFLVQGGIGMISLLLLIFTVNIPKNNVEKENENDSKTPKRTNESDEAPKLGGASFQMSFEDKNKIMENMESGNSVPRRASMPISGKSTETIAKRRMTTPSSLKFAWHHDVGLKTKNLDALTRRASLGGGINAELLAQLAELNK